MAICDYNEMIRENIAAARQTGDHARAETLTKTFGHLLNVPLSEAKLWTNLNNAKQALYDAELAILATINGQRVDYVKDGQGNSAIYRKTDADFIIGHLETSKGQVDLFAGEFSLRKGMLNSVCIYFND